MSAFNAMSQAEIVSLAAIQPPSFAGVQQSEEMLEWIWENFSAVAGDQPSFECWPSKEGYMLHEVLLAGWGCPIGELFDLEKLSEECKRLGRWSFFVTSEVCNVSFPLVFCEGYQKVLITSTRFLGVLLVRLIFLPSSEGRW